MMGGVAALFRYILPQVLVLVGLLGMAVLILRGFKIARMSESLPVLKADYTAQLRQSAKHIVQVASKWELRTAEKSLRYAKIVALKLDNFISKKLEGLTRRKSSIGANAIKGEFWTRVREGKITFSRRSRRHAEQPIVLGPDTDNVNLRQNHFLKRLAEEKMGERQQSASDEDSPG